MRGTVALATLGCKTNQFESAAMEQHLREAGYEVVPFARGADLVIVNTCTVTAATDSQSRNLIRRARRINPACRVVVTGCYAQVNPEALVAIPGVSLVLGNEEKRDFLRLIQEDSDDGTVHVTAIRERSEASVLPITSFAERSRAFVQIQNGCDAFCSYCIIPYARGRSRSVHPEEVITQVDSLVSAGYPEIVLTGIHIGGYGNDLQPRLTLVDLVRRLEAETSLPRLRLGSLEPTEISDALITQVASSPVICPHFHIPLQAGDDDVLKRMNRHYTTAFFSELVKKIHDAIPQAAIGLDVITGFPGENDEAFERTYGLIDALPVSHLHVFPYSRRPGTPAARMPQQVPPAVAKERAARLRTLGERKLEAFSRNFLGETMDVVVEGGQMSGWRKGVTRNYLQVRFASDRVREGQQVRVRIDAWTPDGLVGSLE